jgi:hypothetical protein
MDSTFRVYPKVPHLISLPAEMGLAEIRRRSSFRRAVDPESSQTRAGTNHAIQSRRTMGQECLMHKADEADDASHGFRLKILAE